MLVNYLLAQLSATVICIVFLGRSTINAEQLHCAHGTASGRSQYLPHPSDCNKFIHCVHGVPHERHCPAALHWNRRQLTCDFPKRAQCQVPPVEANGESNCNNGQFYAHERSCQKFYYCKWGKRVLLTCSSGFHWNQKQQGCDTPRAAQCLQRRPPHKLVNGSAYAPCGHGAMVLLPHPEDCSRFISCNDGRAWVMDCPRGLLWSTKRKRCDFAFLAKCREDMDDAKAGTVKELWETETAVGQKQNGITSGAISNVTKKEEEASTKNESVVMNFAISETIKELPEALGGNASGAKHNPYVASTTSKEFTATAKEISSTTTLNIKNIDDDGPTIINLAHSNVLETTQENTQNSQTDSNTAIPLVTRHPTAPDMFDKTTIKNIATTNIATEIEYNINIELLSLSTEQEGRDSDIDEMSTIIDRSAERTNEIYDKYLHLSKIKTTTKIYNIATELSTFGDEITTADDRFTTVETPLITSEASEISSARNEIMASERESDNEQKSTASNLLETEDTPTTNQKDLEINSTIAESLTTESELKFEIAENTISNTYFVTDSVTQFWTSDSELEFSNRYKTMDIPDVSQNSTEINSISPELITTVGESTQEISEVNSIVAELLDSESEVITGKSVTVTAATLFKDMDDTVPETKETTPSTISSTALPPTQTVSANPITNTDIVLPSANDKRTQSSFHSLSVTTTDPRLPFRAPQCRILEQRIKFAARDCRQFYQCFEGYAYLLNCYDGFAFREDWRKCVPLGQTNCTVKGA